MEPEADQDGNGEAPAAAEGDGRVPDLRAAARLLQALHTEETDEDAGAQDADDPRVPGYVVEYCLGRGGGGAVYLARRTGSERQLALKVMRHRLGEGDGARRAWRELELLSGLHLTTLPRVIDYGEHRGRLYIASEFIDGLQLEAHCAAHDLDRRGRVALLAAVASAVHTLHEHGVIHRDIKPSNILVDTNGDPMIIDLGIASLLVTDVMQTLTAEGAPIGTPAYMSPEQARGERGAVSIRSDVYGLGAVGYKVLTGQTPHDMEGTLHSVLLRVGSTAARDPRELRPDLPKPLGAILRRAAANDPRDRYASAAALVDDLGRWLRGEPVAAAPPAGWTRLTRWIARHPVIAGAAGMLLVAGVAALTLLVASSVDNLARRLADPGPWLVSPPIDSPAPAAGAQFGIAVAAGFLLGPDGVPGLAISPVNLPGDGVDDGPVELYTLARGMVRYFGPLPHPEPERDTHFGHPITVIGDLDDDGRPELAVGALRGVRARVYVFSGRDASLVGSIANPEPQPEDGFGAAIAAPGDVNGDGVPDLAVSALSQNIDSTIAAGRLHVFSGADFRLLHAADNPDLPDERPRLGTGLIALGDVDGDGVKDLAATAPYHDGGPSFGTGRSYVFSGADLALLYRIEKPNREPNAIPHYMANIGDVTGDDIDDLCIAAHLQDAQLYADVGQVYVHSGADGALVYTLDHPEPHDVAMFALASLAAFPDLDGDGAREIFVGAPLQSFELNARVGRGYIFSGRTGQLLTRIDHPEPQPRRIWASRFPSHPTWLGDFGRGPAFLVAAPLQDGEHTDQGRAYVFAFRQERHPLRSVAAQRDVADRSGSVETP